MTSKSNGHSPTSRLILLAGALIAPMAILILIWPAAHAFSDTMTVAIRANGNLIAAAVLIIGLLLALGVVRIVFAYGRKLGLIQATPILCIEQMYAPRCPRCYRFIGRCLQLLEAIPRSSLATQWRSRYWIKNTGASYLFMRAIPALAPETLPKHDKKGCYQLSEA